MDFAMPANARSELAYTFAPSSQRPSLQVAVLKVSRVALLKTVSLPLLELSAVLLLVRLINKIRESLELSQCSTYLWSDSTIALN